VSGWRKSLWRTDGLVLHFADVKGHLLTHSTEKVFTVEDERGRVDVTAWHVTGRAEITLELARPLQGSAFVHGAFETDPAGYVPFDDATRWPMLAFYRLPVETGG